MAKVKIHGRFNGGGLKLKEYLVISTDKHEWLDWIPGVIPGGRLLGSQMTSGRKITDLIHEAHLIVGAVPIKELNVEVCGKVGQWCSFSISGAAVRNRLWSKPTNWKSYNNDRLRIALLADMPIFMHKEVAPETKPTGPPTPYKEMSFYESRLAESRAKSREENASAPPNRAFEFL